MILRGVDRQIGLTERLSAAIDDWRHPAYVTHPMGELIGQRTYPIGCGYEDGNDANALRGDALLKLGLERKPLDAAMDLASDRISDSRFLANQMRLFFSCAAYVLHQTLRTGVLAGTELANAQPSTLIIKRFKLAVRVVQYKDRVRLPSSCPLKALLKHVTEKLFLAPPIVTASG